MNPGELHPIVLAQVAPGGGLQSMIPLLLILAVFYFLLIRPQQKRANEHKEFVEGLKVGDSVVSNGGLHGRVAEVGEKQVRLEIADGVRVMYDRDKVAAYSDAKKTAAKKGAAKK